MASHFAQMPQGDSSVPTRPVKLSKRRLQAQKENRDGAVSRHRGPPQLPELQVVARDVLAVGPLKEADNAPAPSAKDKRLCVAAEERMKMLAIYKEAKQLQKEKERRALEKRGGVFRVGMYKPQPHVSLPQAPARTKSVLPLTQRQNVPATRRVEPALKPVKPRVVQKPQPAPPGGGCRTAAVERATKAAKKTPASAPGRGKTAPVTTGQSMKKDGNAVPRSQKIENKGCVSEPSAGLSLLQPAALDSPPKGPLPKDALPKDALPKDALPEGPLPKDALPKDALPKDALPEDALPEDALPEGPLPEGPLPEGPLPDGALPDGALPEGPLPEDALPEGPLPEGPLPKDALPEGPLPKDALPEGPLPKDDLSEGPLPKDALPEGPLPKDDLAEGPLPKDALPEGPLPKDDLPEGALPKGALPDGALPEGALPKDALPEGPLPKDALPEGPLPKDALPEGPLPKDDLSEGPLPKDALPEGPLPKDPLPEGPLPKDALPEGPLPKDDLPEGALPEGPLPEASPSRDDAIPDPSAALEPSRPPSPTPQSPADSQEPLLDVPYFRAVMSSEAGRLTGLCERWDPLIEELSVPEEIRERVRSAVGQARLLLRERFGQFQGLLDDCALGRGERITTCSDLQGFWEMVFFQVEDVNRKFSLLKEAESRGWQEEFKPPPLRIKRAAKKPLVAPAGTAGGGGASAAARSRLAAVKATMKAKREAETQRSAAGSTGPAPPEPPPDATVVFHGGFFQVESPAKTLGSMRRTSLRRLDPAPSSFPRSPAGVRTPKRRLHPAEPRPSAAPAITPTRLMSSALFGGLSPTPQPLTPGSTAPPVSPAPTRMRDTEQQPRSGAPDADSLPILCPAGHAPCPVSPADHAPCPADHAPCPVSPADHAPCPVSPAGHAPCPVSPADHAPCPADHAPCPVSPADHAPCPVSPADHAPCPVNSADHAPCPVSSADHAPCPVSPAGHAPCPVSPAGHAPSPVSPAGHAPCPVSPAGHAPCPVNSADHAPCPVSSAGHAPCPVSPAGHAPSPVSPAGHAPSLVSPAGHAPSPVSLADHAPCPVNPAHTCQSDHARLDSPPGELEPAPPTSQSGIAELHVSPLLLSADAYSQSMLTPEVTDTACGQLERSPPALLPSLTPAVQEGAVEGAGQFSSPYSPSRWRGVDVTLSPSAYLCTPTPELKLTPEDSSPMDQSLPAGHAPSPVSPAGHALSPVSPADHAPSPVSPADHAPSPVNPADHAPSPVSPADHAPCPVSPADHAPCPADHAPSPVSPAGHAPSPVSLADHAPCPVNPAHTCQSDHARLDSPPGELEPAPPTGQSGIAELHVSPLLLSADPCSQSMLTPEVMDTACGQLERSPPALLPSLTPAVQEGAVEGAGQFSSPYSPSLWRGVDVTLSPSAYLCTPTPELMLTPEDSSPMDQSLPTALRPRPLAQSSEMSACDSDRRPRAAVRVQMGPAAGASAASGVSRLDFDSCVTPSPRCSPSPRAPVAVETRPSPDATAVTDRQMEDAGCGL